MTPAAPDGAPSRPIQALSGASSPGDLDLRPNPIVPATEKLSPGPNTGGRPVSEVKPEEKAEPSQTHPVLPASLRSGGRQHQSALARPPSTPSRSGNRIAVLITVILMVVTVLLATRYMVAKPVELMSASRGFFQAEITGPGTLDAIDKAGVSSSLQGVITALYVDRNDVVAKGEIIAEVNAQDLKAQLNASIASQEAARKAVEAAYADSRRAEATLANARSTLVRQRELARTGTSSRSALESAETSVQQGEADVAKAYSSVHQAEAQEAAAVATVEMNRALLDKSVIRAPIDGVVIARNLNIGDIVSPGTVIVEIADPLSIVLTARFDESGIASISAGQTATIRFISQQQTSISGKVRRISRQVDTETREFTADITPDGLPANWAIGQRGIAVIGIAGKSGVIAVPSSAIGRKDGSPGVWMVQNGRAAWRFCELGMIGGKFVEIVDGLNGGDVVITNPESAYSFMRVKEAARQL
ncbi:efflux RND transporter periplasmic adaptor subunit [Rhizobium sp. YS-1r]|uniref:efflux RND transporter periplasmic adaptor subunit n=1 Tax=Rhizobium sp. YS-1r TaxID=1532558 RepID=UPI0009DC94DE|nr:efflux RND transporter periplasmic adaptor subunit [Rhizobium sp. YS-1r]